jgi:hypothetical protein
MAEPGWVKVVRVLGWPQYQRIADAPEAPSSTPGAQAARWISELDADLAARRISPAVYEQRKRAVIDWLANA